MAKVHNFSEHLEAGLNRLGQEIQIQKEHPELRSLPEREVVKRSLEAITSSAPVTTSDVPTTNSSDDAYLPTYLIGDSSTQNVKAAVEHLLELALEKGIEHAVVMGRKTSPFIEDAFHDALIDKLIPELKKRGFFE